MNTFGLDQNNNAPGELEQSKRLASDTSDQTTYQRLREFVEELRQNLKRRLAARRTPSGEQLGPGRGEFHIGARLVQPQPAALDRELKPGAVFGRAAAFLEQERSVDFLDVDSAVLHRLYRVGDL